MDHLTNDIPARFTAIPTVHEAFREAMAHKPWDTYSHPIIRQTVSRVGSQWIKCGIEHIALADFTKEYLRQMDRWEAGLFHVEHNEPLGGAVSREYIKKVRQAAGV